MGTTEQRPDRRLQIRGSGNGQHGADAARSRPYDRARDLPALIPIWPARAAIGAEVAIDRARLLEQLRRALRAERNRGRMGHWTYDLARHAALLRAYRAETAALKTETAAAGADRPVTR